jgi:signal transduction histidine kinase
VNETIRTVLQLREHEQKVNNIETNISLEPDLPEIYGNTSQLQQVLFNLVINAEYFMLDAHKKGVLSIRSESLPGKVRITVADDGPGISAENMRRLFTPFFTSKDVGKGTGLGLSICPGIITEHTGAIWAESTEGQGATFIIELPACEETPPENGGTP